jgi:aminoglycoside/choline kinase family phosphotransferase
MKTSLLEKHLSDLFEEWAGVSPELMLPLAPSGSARIYYRLQHDGKSAMNEAFVGFSRHFHAKGLPVPEIYVEQLDNNVYLQEDLGATTLYSYLLQRDDGPFPNHLMTIYKRVVEDLARVQIRGGQGLDYSKCFQISVSAAGGYRF